MLTGVLLFRGDSKAELMYKITNEAAPDIQLMRNTLPVQLVSVVAKALNKQTSIRYQNGGEFTSDFSAVGVESMQCLSSLVLSYLIMECL